VELTVVGPKVWPLPGEPPEGVRFLGRLPIMQVQRLFAEHDAFVMPSRFEGYGIALIEALAHGLPCVARDDCAMPEIVIPGVNGALVGADSGAAELAEVVASVLGDEALHERTRLSAPSVAADHTWARAAGEFERIVRTIR
jgi:glycosyltransferase involved in cell wall biosynthesis